MAAQTQFAKDSAAQPEADEKKKLVYTIRGAFSTLEAAIRAEDWTEAKDSAATIQRTAEKIEKLNG